MKNPNNGELVTMAITFETAQSTVRAALKRISREDLLAVLGDLEKIDGGESFNDSVQMLIGYVESHDEEE